MVQLLRHDGRTTFFQSHALESFFHHFDVGVVCLDPDREIQFEVYLSADKNIQTFLKGGIGRVKKVHPVSSPAHIAAGLENLV